MALLQNWINTDLFSVMRDKVNAIVTAVNTIGAGAKGDTIVKNSNANFDYVYTKGVSVWQSSTETWNMDVNGNIFMKVFMTGSHDTPLEFIANIVSIQAFVWQSPATVGGNKIYNLASFTVPKGAQGGIAEGIEISPENNALMIFCERGATGPFDTPAFNDARVFVRIIKLGK